VSVGATNVTEERKVCRVCSSLGNSKRNTEDGVCAETLLVLGAVELNHGAIDEALVSSVEAFECWADFVDDGVDCLLNTLTEVTVLVFVAKFVCFESTGGCTGWDCSAGKHAIFEQNLYLNGGVTARVENFACANGVNEGHSVSL
jgi:hypothetical protein